MTTLPTASTPGYTSFRGRTACSCLAQWLPAYEAELQARGLLVGPLPIYQLTGLAAASSLTHSRGGAADLTDQTGDEDLWVARSMGAAAFSRTPPTFNPPHMHLVLIGCPHNLPARYQVQALIAGYDGLSKGGRGGKDTGPRPAVWRNWRDGIAWHEAQVRRRGVVGKIAVAKAKRVRLADRIARLRDVLATLPKAKP